MRLTVYDDFFEGTLCTVMEKSARLICSDVSVVRPPPVVQIAPTASIGQILALRPHWRRPPPATTSSHRRQWYAFGRRLAEWYALLDHCLAAEETTPPSANAEESRSCLFTFPLLCSASGRWYAPNDVGPHSGVVLASSQLRLFFY